MNTPPLTWDFNSKCNDGHCEPCTSENSEHSATPESEPPKNETRVEQDDGNPKGESLDDGPSEISQDSDQTREETPGDKPADTRSETPKKETAVEPEETPDGKATEAQSESSKNETFTEQEKTLDHKPSEVGKPKYEGPRLPIEPPRGDGWTNISKDGKCSKKVSCLGSGFGDCCSTSGYCGSGPKWCGMVNP